MKKFGIILLCICLLWSFSVVTASATSGDIAESTVDGCIGLDAGETLLGNKKIVDNVRAALLYEANSKTLMFAQDADKAMYPASLVKIMTALVALENGKTSDIITVSETAISTVPFDAVSAKLQPGEELSLLDLLYCMIVGSANDAAAVIAEHTKGSQDAFVQEMNAYSVQLGCTGTTYINAHGLHDENQVTTARDVARVLDAALKNETFREIFFTKNYTVAATKYSAERYLKTGNAMVDEVNRLYYDSRVLGGRTGVTEDGRRCLASVAEANGMQLISVVMGTESVYQEDGVSAISVGGYKETTDLLNAGFNGYKTAQILFANQALQQYKVSGGSNDVVVGPNASVSSVLPDNTTATSLSYRMNVAPLSAPVVKGEKLGIVEIYSGTMCVAISDLFALNSVEVAGMAIRQEEKKQESSPLITALIVIAIVIVGAAAILFSIRFYHRIGVALSKKRSARYRRSRRRS